MDKLIADQALDGDVVLDEDRQAYQRAADQWRHLDLVFVESGQRRQPAGELVLLYRPKG